MFHDVSQCFKSVSWCYTSGSQGFMTFHNVSQCFKSVSWCFTMFNNVVRCLVSRATIGITDHLRDRNNAAGIGDNSNWWWRRRDRWYRRESDPMLNSILNEVTLFLEDNFWRGKQEVMNNHIGNWKKTRTNSFFGNRVHVYFESRADISYIL